MLSESYIPWNPEESRAGEDLFISDVLVPDVRVETQVVARVSFDSTSPSRDNAAASLRNLRESDCNPQESQELLGTCVCCLRLP